MFFLLGMASLMITTAIIIYHRPTSQYTKQPAYNYIFSYCFQNARAAELKVWKNDNVVMDKYLWEVCALRDFCVYHFSKRTTPALPNDLCLPSSISLSEWTNEASVV